MVPSILRYCITNTIVVFRRQGILAWMPLVVIMFISLIAMIGFQMIVLKN